VHVPRHAAQPDLELAHDGRRSDHARGGNGHVVVYRVVGEVGAQSIEGVSLEVVPEVANERCILGNGGHGHHPFSIISVSARTPKRFDGYRTTAGLRKSGQGRRPSL
jgi:hypothetical protein